MLHRPLLDLQNKTFREIDWVAFLQPYIQEIL